MSFPQGTKKASAAMHHTKEIQSHFQKKKCIKIHIKMEGIGRMDWLAILPFLVVIGAAIWTKQVIPSLFVGVVTAAYLTTPHIVGGMTTTLKFMVASLKDENNLKIIVFLYGFSALVGLIKMSGGIKGFVGTASSRIHSKRGAFLLTWISALGTFSAPSFRIVTIAPVMKAMRSKIPMTKQELGFVIETTASPFIVLIPVATAFVGYMTSVIDLSLHQAGISGDAYSLFLRSIPFNFFAFAMLIIGFYLSFFHHSKQPATNVQADQQEDDEWEDCHPAVAKDLPAKPLNLILPLISVIVSTFLFMYFLGLEESGSGLSALLNANVLDAMVLGILFTVVWFMIYLLKSYKLENMLKFFVDGGNNIMEVIILLVMVWALGQGSEALHFAEIVSSSFDWIPPAFVAVLLFVIGCGLSYFIGSSWGTWGILMPIGVSIAQVSGSSLPFVIGAVFASGTFGAFASPLSDDTNTSAGILDLNPIQYAKFKLKPALISAAVAAILYFGYPFLIG